MEDGSSPNVDEHPASSPSSVRRPCRTVQRRAAIIGASSLWSLAGAGAASADDAAERMRRPGAGDKLVFASGDAAGHDVTPSALTEGGPQALAWAVDIQTGVVRDGSRLNQVLLLRLGEDGLNDVTRSRSAAGVVAYSAICPHALCPVTEWVKETALLHCPCHNSEYDPKRAAAVVSGPAPRGLAALPLRLDGEMLTVAGPFVGKVGAQQT